MCTPSQIIIAQFVTTQFVLRIDGPFVPLRARESVNSPRLRDSSIIVLPNEYTEVKILEHLFAGQRVYFGETKFTSAKQSLFLRNKLSSRTNKSSNPQRDVDFSLWS